MGNHSGKICFFIRVQQKLKLASSAPCNVDKAKMPTLVGSSWKEVMCALVTLQGVLNEAIWLGGSDLGQHSVHRRQEHLFAVHFTRNNWLIGTQLLSIFPKTNVSQQVSVCSGSAATAPPLVFRIKISMNISYCCLINNTNYAAQCRIACHSLAMLLFSFSFLKPPRQNRNY